MGDASYKTDRIFEEHDLQDNGNQFVLITVSKGRLWAQKLKGGPSDLRTKILQKYLKLSLYSQSLLIFIHKIPVHESHPTTREIRDLLWPNSTPTGNTVYFYMSSWLIYILKKKHR